MPTITYKSIDEVPEDFRGEAKEVEGGEGKVTVKLDLTSKVDEFRTRNVDLSQERDVLKTRTAELVSIIGEDSEGFSKDLGELRIVAQRVADGELTESTAIDEELARRTSDMQKTYDGLLKDKSREASTLQEMLNNKQGELNKNIVDRAISDAALNDRSGARADALQDILARGNSIFKHEDGKVVAKNGDATIYGTNGADPLTPYEWITGDLKTQAPYLFKDSSGGGAYGGDKITGDATLADLDGMSAKARLDYANMNPDK